MIHEVNGDLFRDLDSPDCFVHCVAGDILTDIRSGKKGIVVPFERWFKIKKNIKLKYGLVPFETSQNIYFINDKNQMISNLITKKYYYLKPTYDSLSASLWDLKTDLNKIYWHKDKIKIHMPCIGCGLDRLQWNKVLLILKDIFNEEKFDITVFHYK